MIKKTVLLLSSILVALAVLEILLRIFWQPSFLNPKYKRDDLKWLQENVKLNHFNYRDKEFNLLKEESTYRIYVLGDSYTFGWYINDPSLAYPKVLEETLHIKIPSQKIEVINAGRHGFDLPQYIERFETEGYLFNPDLVLVGNIIWDNVNANLPKPFIKNRLIRNLRLYQLTFGTLERLRLGKASLEALNKSYQDSSADFKKTEEAYKKLRQQTSAMGAKLAIVVFPEFNPARPNDKYQFDFYHQQMSKIGKKLDIPIIDLKEAFQNYPDKTELVLNPTDPHPSIVANQIAGEFIADFLLKEKLLEHKAAVFKSNQITMSNDQLLPNINGILEISPGWVYFFEKDKTVQKNFLPISNDRKVYYLEDNLLTTKSLKEGKPEAKVEYYLPGNTDTLVLLNTLYGFPVLDIAKISGYWRTDGDLQSEEIDLKNLEIINNNNQIAIKTNKKYELYKLTVNINVKQVNVENGRVTLPGNLENNPQTQSPVITFF